MDFTGKHSIATALVATGKETFKAFTAADDKTLDVEFFEATDEDVQNACSAASEAFAAYQGKSGLEIANFLETIAQEIEALGPILIETAKAETGLPEGRLVGERGRTMGQMALFANALKDGSWVNAIIDKAKPERQPLPKADIRMMQMPIGPVAVFGASNFPFAFSVAGGDTASALASGCTVVFKAHPAHPHTCELVAVAINNAIKKCDMPSGTFNMVQGKTHQTGTSLVNNALIKAVAFTGSFNGGKALFDLAAKRKTPIPVYAEMGSVNPVVFLEGVLKENGTALAKSFAESVTLGVGQFCTNPGLFVLQQSPVAEKFVADTAKALSEIAPGPMLTSQIRESFLSGVGKMTETTNVTRVTGESDGKVSPHLFTTQVADAIANDTITEEIFGPSTVGVYAKDKQEILQFAESLDGHLTATIFGTAEDLANNREIINALQQKVGRLIFNNFPTGVEVTHAMVHGGPFPATTHAGSTSVGTTAIYRFTRPVCFQNCPNDLLPSALQEENPLGIVRLIDGVSVKH